MSTNESEDEPTDVNLDDDPVDWLQRGRSDEAQAEYEEKAAEIEPPDESN